MGRETLSSASARIQSNVVKALTGYYRLKDFIHAVRACKTLAEERALVSKEAAAIRTSFKEDISADQRHHAVAKLLFMYMMGYPAHFGQVESLKMVASPRIAEKRLGYLGSTQLLDEQQPTLTLITNSIKHDLNNSTQSIASLALSNFAATASADIARDLADEVERLLQCSSPFLKKKAAFCAARMVSKVPELAEMFGDRLLNLLSDRNHAVVMGGVTLAQQMCIADAEMIQKFRKSLVPSLIRQLQHMISGGFSSEYDVGGVCDPFLQVRILRFLRTLGEGDQETSDAISDILTQIATSTDPSKNVGHSVLYETAVTIMNIQSDQSLRTMAINILGRLLSSNSSDSNLRYVALALLNKIIAAGHEGLGAVQRHRATILECLHEHDPSIRRRAVDLAIGLISKDTIRSIAAELLDVLRSLSSAEDLDFKQSLVTRLAIASAQFAPSAKWYVDTMKVILSEIDDSSSLGIGPEAITGGKEEIVSTFLRIINNTAELHRYATEELWKVSVLKETILAHDDSDRVPSEYHVTEALIQATAWSIGEFADILVSARLADQNQLIDILSSWADPKSGYSPVVIGYIVTSLGKLADRLPSASRVAKIEGILEGISLDYVNDCNLHYRAREMQSIVGNPALRSILMARIPPDTAGDQLGRVASASKLSASHKGFPKGQPHEAMESLEGLQSPSDSVSNVKPVVDVFAELATLSLDGVVSPCQSGRGQESTFSAAGSPFNLDDKEEKGEPVYERYGIAVYSNVQLCLKEKTVLKLKVINRSENLLENVVIQAAVPKSMKITLDPADSDRAQPGDGICQTFTVTMNDAHGLPIQVPFERLKLRIKLTFQLASVSPEPIVEVFDITKFH